MTVKSGIGRGLQRQGTDAGRDWAITIETDGMDLLVKSGGLTFGGASHTLSADETHTITADATDPTWVAVGLQTPSSPTTYVLTTTEGDETPQNWPDIPTDHICWVVGKGWMKVPAGETDLANVDIYTWTVMDNSVTEVRENGVKAFASECTKDGCSTTHTFTEIEHTPKPKGPNQHLVINPEDSLPTPTTDASGINHPVKIKTIQ